MQDPLNNIIKECIYGDKPGGFYTYNTMVFSLQQIDVGNEYVNNY